MWKFIQWVLFSLGVIASVLLLVAGGLLWFGLKTPPDIRSLGKASTVILEREVVMDLRGCYNDVDENWGFIFVMFDQGELMKDAMIADEVLLKVQTFDKRGHQVNEFVLRPEYFIISENDEGVAGNGVLYALSNALMDNGKIRNPSARFGCIVDDKAFKRIVSWKVMAIPPDGSKLDDHKSSP